MSTVVTMPQRGLTEESALLATWYVKNGDHVKTGDPLFAIEIGKATFDVEAETEGVVLSILAQAGDDVPIKTPVCIIGQPGESFEGPAPTANNHQKEEHAHSLDAPIADSSDQVTACEEKGPFISPRAREMASRLNLDYKDAIPSGPEGRIIQRDIELLAGQSQKVTSQPIAVSELEEDYTKVPNSGIRQLIARNMHRSLSEMAQLSMTAYFDAGNLLALRDSIKKHKDDEDYVNITLNDMILFAVSRVVLGYPYLNAHYSEQETKLFHHVNLGVAVNTDRGLMVPTIKEADRISLRELSLQAKQLAEACKESRISPEYLSGGTITVSNLGNTGISSFTPIINPPQTALVGVCGMEWKVRPDLQGKPELYQAMSLSLTIDHRAVDGAPAAAFLHDLCRKLEEFSLLLIG